VIEAERTVSDTIVVVDSKSSSPPSMFTSQSRRGQFVDIDSPNTPFRQVVQKILVDLLGRSTSAAAAFRNDLNRFLQQPSEENMSLQEEDSSRLVFCHVSVLAGDGSSERRRVRIGQPVELEQTPADLGAAFVPPMLCVLRKAKKTLNHSSSHVREGRQLDIPAGTEKEAHRRSVALENIGDVVLSGSDEDETGYGPSNAPSVSTALPPVVTLDVIGCDALSIQDRPLSSSLTTSASVVSLTVPSQLNFRQILLALLVRLGRTAQQEADLSSFELRLANGLTPGDCDTPADASRSDGSLIARRDGGRVSMMLFVTARTQTDRPPPMGQDEVYGSQSIGRKKSSRMGRTASFVVKEPEGSPSAGSDNRGLSTSGCIDPSSSSSASILVAAEEKQPIRSKQSFRDRRRSSTANDALPSVLPSSWSPVDRSSPVGDAFACFDRRSQSSETSLNTLADQHLTSEVSPVRRVSSTLPFSSELLDLYGCGENADQRYEQRLIIARNAKRAQDCGLASELLTAARRSLADEAAFSGGTTSTDASPATLRERRGLLSYLRVLLTTYRVFFRRDHHAGWDPTILAERIIASASSQEVGGFAYFAQVSCALQNWVMAGVGDQRQILHVKEPARRALVEIQENLAREGLNRAAILSKEAMRRRTVCRVHLLVLEETLREGIERDLEDTVEAECRKVLVEGEERDSFSTLVLLEFCSRESNLRKVLCDDEVESLLLAEAQFQSTFLRLQQEHFSKNLLLPFYTSEEDSRTAIANSERLETTGMMVSLQESLYRVVLAEQWLLGMHGISLEMTFVSRIVEMLGGTDALQEFERLIRIHQRLFCALEESCRGQIVTSWHSEVFRKYHEFSYLRLVEQEARFAVQRADLETKERIARSIILENSDLQNQMWFNVMDDTNANLWALHNSRLTVWEKEHRKRNHWLQQEDYCWRVMMGHLELDVIISNNARRIERDQQKFFEKMLLCEQEMHHRRAITFAYDELIDRTKAAAWKISQTNDRFAMFSRYQQLRNEIADLQQAARTRTEEISRLQLLCFAGIQHVRESEAWESALHHLRFEQKAQRWEIEYSENALFKDIMLAEYSGKTAAQRKQTVREARDEQLAMLELFTTIRFLGGPVPRTQRINVECPKDMPLGQILHEYVFPQLRASRPHLTARDMLALYDLVERDSVGGSTTSGGTISTAAEAQLDSDTTPGDVLNLESTLRQQLHHQTGAILLFVPKVRKDLISEAAPAALAATSTTPPCAEGRITRSDCGGEETTDSKGPATAREEDLLPMPQLPPVPRRVRSVVAPAALVFPTSGTVIETAAATVVIDEARGTERRGLGTPDDDDDERILIAQRRSRNSKARSEQDLVGRDELGIEGQTERERQQQHELAAEKNSELTSIPTADLHATEHKPECLWSINVMIARSHWRGSSVVQSSPSRVSLKCMPSWTLRTVLEMVAQVRSEFAEMLERTASHSAAEVAKAATSSTPKCFVKISRKLLPIQDDGCEDCQDGWVHVESNISDTKIHDAWSMLPRTSEHVSQKGSRSLADNCLFMCWWEVKNHHFEQEQQIKKRQEALKQSQQQAVIESKIAVDTEAGSVDAAASSLSSVPQGTETLPRKRRAGNKPASSRESGVMPRSNSEPSDLQCAPLQLLDQRRDEMSLSSDPNITGTRSASGEDVIGRLPLGDSRPLQPYYGSVPNAADAQLSTEQDQVDPQSVGLLHNVEHAGPSTSQPLLPESKVNANSEAVQIDNRSDARDIIGASAAVPAADQAARPTTIWSRLKSLFVPSTSSSSSSIYVPPPADSSQLPQPDPSSSIEHTAPSLNIRVAGGPISKDRRLIVAVAASATVRMLLDAVSEAIGIPLVPSDYHVFPVVRQLDPMKPAVPDKAPLRHEDSVSELKLPAVVLKLTPEAKLREASAKLSANHERGTSANNNHNRYFPQADVSYCSTEWEVADDLTSADEQPHSSMRDRAAMFLPDHRQRDLAGGRRDENTSSRTQAIPCESSSVVPDAQELLPHLQPASKGVELELRLIGLMIPREASVFVRLPSAARMEDVFPLLAEQVRESWAGQRLGPSLQPPDLRFETHELATMIMQPDGVATVGAVFEPFDSFETKGQLDARVLLVRRRQKPVDRSRSLAGLVDPGARAALGLAQRPPPSDSPDFSVETMAANVGASTFRARIVGLPIPRSFVLVVEHVRRNRPLSELLCEVQAKLVGAIPGSVIATLIPGIYTLARIPDELTTGIELYSASGLPIDTIQSLATTSSEKAIPLDLNAAAWVNTIPEGASCWMLLVRVDDKKNSSTARRKSEVTDVGGATGLAEERREQNVTSSIGQVKQLEDPVGTSAVKPRGSRVVRDVSRILSLADEDDAFQGDQLLQQALEFDCINLGVQALQSAVSPDKVSEKGSEDLSTDTHKKLRSLRDAGPSHITKSSSDVPAESSESVLGPQVATASNAHQHRDEDDFDYYGAAAALGIRSIAKLSPRSEAAFREMQKPKLPEVAELLKCREEVAAVEQSLPLRGPPSAVMPPSWELGEAVDLSFADVWYGANDSSANGMTHLRLPDLSAGLDLDEEDPVVLPADAPPPPLRIHQSPWDRRRQQYAFPTSPHHGGQPRESSIRHQGLLYPEADDDEVIASSPSLDMRQSSTHRALHASSPVFSVGTASVRKMYGASDAEHLSAMMADEGLDIRSGTVRKSSESASSMQYPAERFAPKGREGRHSETDQQEHKMGGMPLRRQTTSGVDDEDDEEERHVQAIMRKLSRAGDSAAPSSEADPRLQNDTSQRPAKSMHKFISEIPSGRSPVDSDGNDVEQRAHVADVGGDGGGDVQLEVRRVSHPSELLGDPKALEEEVRRISKTLERQPRPDAERLLKKKVFMWDTEQMMLQKANGVPSSQQELGPLRSVGVAPKAIRPRHGVVADSDSSDDGQGVWGGARIRRQDQDRLRRQPSSKKLSNITDLRRGRGEGLGEALPARRPSRTTGGSSLPAQAPEHLQRQNPAPSLPPVLRKSSSVQAAESARAILELQQQRQRGW
jgi:hypothetical protein